jgi:hypothetical protein
MISSVSIPCIDARRREVRVAELALDQRQGIPSGSSTTACAWRSAARREAPPHLCLHRAVVKLDPRRAG